MNPALLVVEDDDTIRETISEALTMEGFDVTPCANGLEASRQLGDRPDALPYSLVVLDLMLPGLGGLDLCRRMRQSGDRTPILVVSAEEDEVHGSAEYHEEERPREPRAFAPDVPRSPLRGEEGAPGSHGGVVRPS